VIERRSGGYVMLIVNLSIYLIQIIRLLLGFGSSVEKISDEEAMIHALENYDE